MRIVGIIFIGLFAASIASFNTASQAQAQTPAAAPTEEQKQQWLLQQNMEKFEAWRDSIPDYEKRLYDRVKAINKRVIRLQNLVIASFFLLLIFNYVFLTFIYRRIGGMTRTPDSSELINASSDEAVSRESLPSISKGTFVGIGDFFLQSIPEFLSPLTSRIGKYFPKVVAAPAPSETDFPPINSFRSLQNAVLRGLADRDIPLRQEIRIFAIWFLPFVVIAFLLMVINPYQSLHAMDLYQAFVQTMNQIFNGNSAFGISANWLIYGSGDFAMNARLLPAFQIGALFPDKYLPAASFTIFAAELFVAIYISCRLFRLPIHIAMITAWLAPLVYIPFVNPYVVLLEHLLVTPFMFNMSGMSILFIALFYRLGKSGIGSTIAISCGLFLIVSYETMAFLYYFIIFAYNIVWACLPLFLFASSMKERAVKAVAGLILGGVFYVVFYGYIDAFYNFNMNDTVMGGEHGGETLFRSIWHTLVLTFTSIDGFFTTVTLKALPIYAHAQNIPFTALFLYLSLASGIFYTVFTINRISSIAFQASMTMLFTVFGAMVWRFGYHEVIIAPLFAISFVLGVAGIVQILSYFFRRWLPVLGVPKRQIENGIMFVSRRANAVLALPGGVIMNVRGYLYLGLVTAFAIFYIGKVSHSPDSKMGFVYGDRPDMEAYRILEREIGINHSPVFRGRLAGMAYIEGPGPYYRDERDPSGKTILRDIFVMERDATWRVASVHGGDFTFTPRLDRIPILHDNNRFTGPGMAVVERYLLSEPLDRLIVQNHNISKFDRRIMEMLGVRFVLMSDPMSEEPGVVLRKTDTINRFLTQYLYELPGANTGSYSPTRQTVFTTAKQALDLISDPATNFRETVLVEKKVPGTLVPASSSETTINGDILSVEARSDGKSLVVLPFEYSRCLTLENKPGTSSPLPELLPVNLNQVGMVFENSASVNIRFRFSPINTNCRVQDRLDWKNLKGTELRSYKGVYYYGGYETY